MCCLPLAGSEQLNDKEAYQPQALQTAGRWGTSASKRENGEAMPTLCALNHGEQKLNLPTRETRTGVVLGRVYEETGLQRGP